MSHAMLDKRQTRFQFLSFFVFQGKERDWNCMTWSRDQPENWLSVSSQSGLKKEWSRLSSSPLGTFRRTQPQKSHSDDVKAFRNLVRSSDGLQYGISVVEAQTSLSWNVPSGKGRRETAVFAGLGKYQVFTLKIGPHFDTTLKEFRRDNWQRKV